MKRVAGLALALAIVLQPFAICCAAGAAAARETRHAAPHHEEEAHSGGAPTLTAVAACTTGAPTPPALRERPPDPAPARMGPAALAVAASSVDGPGRAMVPVHDLPSAHPTIPLRL